MEHLPYFVTFAHVVQAGSFVAGAEKLKLSASVASKHIAKLEQQMGARLLNRSTRKLSLTEAGSAFYLHAQRILDEIEQSQLAVQQLQGEAGGHLRISALNSLTNAVVTPLLPEFLRRYPKIRLEIICSDRLVDLTEDGYDLALRITRQPAPHLVARPLAEIRFAVCAAPEYLKRHGTPAKPADLLAHRCLGYPRTITGGSAWKFLSDDSEEEVAVQPVLEINSVEALRALALAGEGIALLPTYAVAEELRQRRLVTPMPQYRGFSESTLYAVYLQNRYGSPKLRAFVDFMIEKLSPATGGERPPPKPRAGQSARAGTRARPPVR